MAGDCLKMRVDLATDPAVISIASDLDVTEFEVVGMLHHFWSWVDAQSRDGHAVGVTKKWIDRYTHKTGFADAMEKVDWLLVIDGGIEVPKFDRHNGQSAKARGLGSKRQAARRENMSRETSRSERDKNETREEKEREKREELSPSFPLQVEKPATKAPSKKTKIPNPFLLTAEMRSWAAESAPAVDLKTETEKFVDYWRGEAKTKADWPATWRNWIRKAQQDANRPGQYRGSAPINRQQQIEDMNNAVVEQIRQEQLSKQQGLQGDLIDLGEVIEVTGERIE